MLDRWYRTLRLPITIEQFRQLPRNPAYKYEYFGEQAWLSPRPKTFNALLDLPQRLAVDSVTAHGETITLRPLSSSDWAELPELFAAAFGQVPPFSALTDEERLEAARECLEQTHSGGDGPLIEGACFVAEEADSDLPLGAILITLIPRREEGEPWSGEWEETPTTESGRRLLGRPHLTWIFVAPLYARHGIGSALLDRSVAALRDMGYSDLASTFLLGNESTMLWHWRNGFRVLPHPWSLRGK